MHFDNDYTKVHFNRFKKSIEYLKSTGVDYKNILECGEPSVFTDLLKEAYPEAKITHTDGDLRHTLGVKGTFDLVISMEIIEHLKDIEDYKKGDYEKMSTWQYSGVKSYLNLVKKVSDLDTVFFISTPNVNTYKSIEHLLYGYCPFMYQPHVRELSLSEIFNLLAGEGFNIIRRDVVDVWNSHNVPDSFKREIDALSRKLKANVERGDNVFLICKKSI